MKNNIQIIAIILIFCLSCNSYCQNKDQEHYLGFSAGFDIRNAINGSDATKGKPELDALFQFMIVSQGVEINLGYENFNAICFSKYTLGVGYHFPLYGRIGNTVIKTILIPSIEPTIINRWGTEWETRSAHLSIGGNVALRWNINDDFSVEFLTNFLPRTDLKARYPELHSNVPIITSNYLKIIYKIQR